MERKVGEIFEYNGEWYQCVEQPKQYDCETGCGLCSFKIIGNCDLEKCSGTYRSDGKSVIFKKLEKVGEPYVNDDRTYQLYKLTVNVEKLSCQCDGVNLIRFDMVEIEIKKNKEDMEEEKKMTYEELKHYYDSTCGLWAIDRNPKEVTLEWIVENAFQLGDTTHEKVCVSNLKPFDLKAAKVGKPVCTRGGKKARIICWDKKGSAPIVALIEHEDSEFDLSYHNNGSYMSEGESGNDLMMLTKKKEGWLNIFKDFEDTVCCVYPTEKDYITTIKIEWEE